VMPVCFSNAVTSPLTVCSCWPLYKVIDCPDDGSDPDELQPPSTPHTAKAKTTVGQRLILNYPSPGRQET
jgi:hypothetical protein